MEAPVYFAWIISSLMRELALKFKEAARRSAVQLKAISLVWCKRGMRQ